jgi:hypothetical protein
MANSDKNIIITPYISGVTQPQMKFVGQGNDPIYLKVLDGVTGTGATAGGALSIEGSAGQLFSIVNRLGTGSIFSVNDISGIPMIDANANGTISIAGYFGNVGVGLTAPTEKFQVVGNISATGSVVGNQKINAQTGTTYSLVLSDSGKLVTLNNASGITMTFPTYASVGITTGAVVYFAQLGAGTVGFTGAAGVSVRTTPGLFLRTQYSTASAIKIATDEWLLSGDMTA